MDDVQDIIKQLGIAGRSEAEQERIIDEYDIRVGDAIAATLTEEQFEEFKAITYQDQPVIDAWLAKFAPDYKETDLYKELIQDEDEVQATKVFATVGWLEENVPDYQAIADRVLDAFKKELAGRTTA